MGYARIVSGGPTGRYTIEVDYGQNVKDAVLGALSILLSNINAEIGLAQMQVNEADALEAEAIQTLEELQDGYIAEALANPGSEISTLQLRGQAFILQQLRASNTPIRVKLKLLQHERKTTLDRIAYWNGFQPLQTKDVWCTTLTEDAEAGWFVATIDIPGETNLQLLAPECRGWTQTDGVMTARELMSPEQAFFNAAILPGWQKFKPTYRWGTITALDYEADTANVSLFAAVSSAQRLGVNKASSLSNVPVEYLTCNARAFEVGDRCVVQFQGQDWGTPKVIGFLDNPKRCVAWRILSAQLVDNLISGPPRYLIAFFESLTPNDQVEALLADGYSAGVDFRIDRGPWIPAVDNGSGPLTGTRIWASPIGPNGGNLGGLQMVFVEPGNTPTPEGAFTPSPGAPALFRVSFYLDSGFSEDASFAPPYPLESIIEVRMTVSDFVYANMAVKSSFAPFYVDSGVAIPESVANVLQLDYVLFQEDGT